MRLALIVGGVVLITAFVTGVAVFLLNKLNRS
jgi:hypothetical protein